MANIRLVSTTTIKARSRKNPSHIINLTPWDLQLLLVGPIQKGLLFHKPKSRLDQQLEEKISDNSSLIQHLKASLSRTLDFFSPLAGRLATVEHGRDMTSFFIDCNNAGAIFVHAAADGVRINDITQSIYVPNIVKSFFSFNDMKNLEGTFKPLLAVRVTELEDGIFVGCTMNHMVGDGSSFWHFFNSWSEVSRGLVNISKPPVLDRLFVDGTHSCVIKIPRLNEKDKHSSDGFILPPLRQRVFHFTREIIAELKARANAEIGTIKISSLQALLAHLWRSIVRCRNLDHDRETHYRLLIGARQRLLHPQLTTEYFGNAVQAGTVSLKARELLEHGIGLAAWKMNRMVAEHTEEKLRMFLENWMENPKLLTMNNVTTNALVTSSSPRFNVYGNDFGWGKPIAVRSGAGNKHDGKITVYPGIEDGSVDIEVSLLPEILQAMENDSEFMSTVFSSKVSGQV